MHPEDDPEARIRELERPLEDRARAAELTTQPYRTGQRGGFRLRRSVLGTIVAASAVASTAAFFYFTNLPVGSAPQEEARTVSVGGSPEGPPAAAPRIPGSEPGPGKEITAPPRGHLNVSGVNRDKAIACDDSAVNVSGVSNTVTITGHCAMLTVSGVGNQVTVESVDTIDASGFDNRVTYRSGSPLIERSGQNNTVEQG